MGLSIEYTVVGRGWAQCRITSGASSVLINASYLSDALASLVSSAINLLRGAEVAAAEFQDEPGQYRIVIHRGAADPDAGRLQVLRFEESFAHVSDCEGEILLEAACRIRAFTGAVLSTCRRLLNDLGREGYATMWVNHPFPIDLLQELEALQKAKRPFSSERAG